MSRDDDSFWLDIFRKAPIVAAFFAIGGVAGCGIALCAVSDASGRGVMRVFQCAVITGTGIGLFVGLIVGVLVDTLVGYLCGKDKKK